MSMDWLCRTAMVFGDDAVARLAGCRVAVFGLGGVGGNAAEALVRSGIGAIDLIDCDIVNESNLNRQLFALRSTLGMKKTEAARRRLMDVNPALCVTVRECFFLPETADQFDFHEYDYVVDAIDTVKGKIELVLRANAANVPVISSMGCAGKNDPSRLRVSDIYQTSVCPLAKVMRAELRKRGVRALKTVFSDEVPALKENRERTEESGEHRVRVIGSTAFVPPAAGLLIASEVVKDLIRQSEADR